MARPNTEITADALIEFVNSRWADAREIENIPKSEEFRTKLVEIAQGMQLKRALGEDWKILESRTLPKDEKGSSIIDNPDMKALANFYFRKFKADFKLPYEYFEPETYREASAARAAYVVYAIQNYVNGLGTDRTTGTQEQTP